MVTKYKGYDDAVESEILREGIPGMSKRKKQEVEDANKAIDAAYDKTEITTSVAVSSPGVAGTSPDRLKKSKRRREWRVQIPHLKVDRVVAEETEGKALLLVLAEEDNTAIIEGGERVDFDSYVGREHEFVRELIRD